MIVRNRSTKKDHELLRANWDKMPDKHKNLFDIINPNDTEISMPVVGSVIKPNETQTKKPKKNEY